MNTVFKKSAAAPLGLIVTNLNLLKYLNYDAWDSSMLTETTTCQVMEAFTQVHYCTV